MTIVEILKRNFRASSCSKIVLRYSEFRYVWRYPNRNMN